MLNDLNVLKFFSSWSSGVLVLVPKKGRVAGRASDRSAVRFSRRDPSTRPRSKGWIFRGAMMGFKNKVNPKLPKLPKQSMSRNGGPSWWFLISCQLLKIFQCSRTQNGPLSPGFTRCFTPNYQADIWKCSWVKLPVAWRHASYNLQFWNFYHFAASAYGFCKCRFLSVSTENGPWNADKELSVFLKSAQQSPNSSVVSVVLGIETAVPSANVFVRIGPVEPVINGIHWDNNIPGWYIWVNEIIFHKAESCGHLGMISQQLTMIPRVRSQWGRDEIYPDT